jgi:Ca2+-binding EF-hand superfamily protein
VSDWAAGTREEIDMRVDLGALHRATVLCSIFALAIAAPAIADESEDSKKRGTRQTQGLEKADANGDGSVSEEEREAARSARQERHFKEFDTDGDGNITAEERTVARERHEARQLKEFDVDQDGELSPEERQAAQRARLRRGSFE